LIIPNQKQIWSAIGGCLLVAYLLTSVQAAAPVFNIKTYGATAQKSDDARPAIQKAIDACAAAGAGTVLIPPGEYTSGTLKLRSHVHIQIEVGATLFASQDTNAYEFGAIPSKAALFFGENLEDVSIAGQGTVDGQAEYEWRLDDFEEHFSHKTLMQSLGKPLMRSFPKGFPKRQIYPHLVWLGRCKDVQFTGLSFLHSPNWTIALYGCERVKFDRLNVQSSLKEGVWADGIDMDGCKEVLISNCTIATGDDCVVFISENSWGPALNCENITVTNCRLSSASAGIKFSEGIRASVRNIRVSNTVLTNVNRGIVFSPALGGGISNVFFSDLTIDCNRFDWFWAGDGQPFHLRTARMSEWINEPAKSEEPPPSPIKNIQFRNITARAKGSSLFYGHPESPLDNITFENVKLTVASDPAAPFDKAEHALHFRWAKDLKLKKLDVLWAKPALPTWKSALCLEHIDGLQLDTFSGVSGSTDTNIPAVQFLGVRRAILPEQLKTANK
jgi:hypothetical protein